MNENERFVQDLFTRTEAAIRAVRGDAAKEAEIFAAAVCELVQQVPDAKAPHIFSSEGWGRVLPLFDTLEPSDEELDRWSDVLIEAWHP
jgi:hypothetical protein